MSGAAGSSNLNPEQTAWFERKFGIRMVTVQTNADRPSRRQRRAARKQAKR